MGCLVIVSDSPCLQGTDGVNLCDAHNGSQGLKSSAAAFPHLHTTWKRNSCKQHYTTRVNRSAVPVTIQSFHQNWNYLNKRMIHLSITTHDNLFASKHYICGPLQADRDKHNDTHIYPSAPLSYTNALLCGEKAAVACFWMINSPHPSRMDSRQQ